MITEEMLQNLRNRISSMMSEHRYRHTIGVEKMAVYLAGHCLPQKKLEISAAALLHDITKEFSYSRHIDIIEKAKISVDAETLSTPSVLHSFTASYIVRREFADFADAHILSAIEKHTLGDEDMSVFDKIIFLADFIEETRTYPDSITTAKFVKSSMRKKFLAHNLQILDRACIMEFDSTLAHLERCGKPVNIRTVMARNSFISKN